MDQIYSETYKRQRFQDFWLKSQERERDSVLREKILQQWAKASQQRERESLKRQRRVHMRELRGSENEIQNRAYETQHPLQGSGGDLQEIDEPIQRERGIRDLLRQSWKLNEYEKELQLQKKEQQVRKKNQRRQKSEQQFQYDEREYRVQLSETSGPHNHILRESQPGPKALRVRGKPLRRSLRLLQLRSAESGLRTQSHGCITI
ncbi:hypothetical protein E4U32_001259 [Claviceps aff. humidiphila group G2b]|nr:hypothetical protein E4U32_001259 [Claviceps aff. humidiphila group G2b]